MENGLTEEVATNGISNVHLKSKMTSDDVPSKCLVTSQDDVNEVIINVSKDVASMALGFSIDAGGSVTKLVYRSKEDYENGIPKDINSVDGKLRLRYMKNHDGKGIIQFLHQNCDIRDSSLLSGGGGGDEGDNSTPFWYNTGVGYQHYKKTIEDDLHIRTKILSEMDGLRRALTGIYSKKASGSLCLKPLPLSPSAMQRSLFFIRQMMTMMKSYKEIGDKSIGEMFKESDSKIEEYAMKLMTSDPAELASELGLSEIEYPCLFVLIGSAFTLSIIAGEDKAQTFGDFSSMSGKTFLGLGMILTGAKNFKELVEMASRGNSSKVDTLAGDLKNRDREDVDWYSLMQDNFVVFSLGKMSEKQYDGTYSKEDLAAGLVQMFSDSISKLAIAHARLHNVQTVIFTGSYLCEHVIRESLQECFYKNTLMLPFHAEAQLKMGILSNPGYLCALGTWQTNLDLEKERKLNQCDEKPIL